ncbi:MAG: hypothetical protein L3K06_01350 [Thermoplasmata archaeon]|nr:hypothetical protein [Thermoplasmata archaeon]MCI4353996.1 hypothetical protein [Thermoplasmata archaeon]
MADPAPVPTQKLFSSSMRVDALLSDWRAALEPEIGSEDRERSLYDGAWTAYLEGDFGFGLWCWFECDRLTNAFNGAVREVTRVLGQGRYFGFSHRKAVAAAVPIERVYRPRKGDMSTPRTDAIILPHYQALCVYLVRARSGDRKSQAQLEIALGELEDRRRADPFLKHFETFRRLLERPAAPPTEAAIPPADAPAAAPPAPPPGAARRRTPQ